jgi:hypothetical protein
MKVFGVEAQQLQGKPVKLVDFGEDNEKAEIGMDLTDGSRKWRVVGHIYPDRNETKPMKIVMSGDFDLAVGDEVTPIPLAVH